MSPYSDEYRCTSCGHKFNTLKRSEALCCPRCCSDQIEKNPFLFGTDNADELTAGDYIATLFQPCCGDAHNLSQCPVPDKEKE